MNEKVAMSRTHLYLPTTLVKQLWKKARADGIGLSELIRRILFAYIDEN